MPQPTPALSSPLVERLPTTLLRTRRVAARGTLALAWSTLFLISATALIPDSSPHLSFIGEAQAIIGLPFTPLSVAGVARRTAYREVAYASTAAVVTSAAVASASAQQAAAAQAAAAARPPAPMPASGPLPVGTVVAALPGGCVSAPISGQEYYLCNGTYYRAAFQGTNLIYVVVKP